MSHATKKKPHTIKCLAHHCYVMNILTLSELCKKIFTEIPIHVNLIYIFTTKVLNSSWGGSESFD